MRTSLLSLLVATVMLAGCASTGATPPPAPIRFEFKFLGNGQVCQVTATDLRSKQEMFAQTALSPNRRGNDASYENGDTGQMLVVRLVHEDSGKYLCAAVVAEGGKVIASERHEQ